MKQKKKIPEFKNEDEEREFWSKRDSSEYINWDKSKRMKLTNLKPSTKSISLRLPESMYDQLRILANKKDIPYQSLLKIFVSERINREIKN